MKKIFLALLLVVLMASPVFAIVYESITVAGTGIGLTITNLDWTHTKAYCTLETAQIRFRIDGADPTSSEGHIMNVGDSIVLQSYEELKNFRAIRTGSSGTLKCSY